MASIVIKEILPSDKISEIVDKINFNFDQLLLNGGGPAGPIGAPGPTGPIGPKGTVWFTCNDLWTTPSSPLWAGSPNKANNPSITGYPQYTGDPNRFKPSVLSSTYPDDTLTFNTNLKPVRNGDLYLQESDDNFNSQPSKDGDIWQFDSTTSTWINTGVNIKGEQGIPGQNATSEWIRQSNLNEEIIYPKDITGQDKTRVYLGGIPASPPTLNVFDLDNPDAFLTINTDLTHIALNHPSIHNESVSSGSGQKGAIFTMTSDGDLILKGSSVGNNKYIILQSNDSDIIINSGGINFLTYRQQPLSSIHVFEGGAIKVNHPDNNSLKYTKFIAPVSATESHILTQEFITGESKVNIYTSSSSTNAPPHIILQNGSLANVGIGNFSGLNVPLSRLSINGNLSIGNNFANVAAPPSGAIIEGKVGIGTSSFPTGSNHILEVNGSIVLSDHLAHLAQNVYWNGNTNNWIHINTGPSWLARQEASNTPSNTMLSIFVSPAGNSMTQAILARSISFRQNINNQENGKIGINVTGPGDIVGRLTINDTDGTGIYFIRRGSSFVDFGPNINTEGARIYHATSTIGSGQTFNIVQYEPADFILSNKIASVGTVHPRIVMKPNEPYIGINTDKPNDILTIKGRDCIPWNADPDEVNMGTFNDTSVYGLNVNTTPPSPINDDIVGGTHDGNNIKGGPYIGFNAWFEPATPTNSAAVVYGPHEDDGAGSGYSGAIIFMDRNGNIHFANYEAKQY